MSGRPSLARSSLVGRRRPTAARSSSSILSRGWPASLRACWLATPLALALLGASPASAQATTVEIQRAAHMLRRMEYGVSPLEIASLLPTASMTQDQLFATYAMGQLTPTGADNVEAAGLLGLYQAAPISLPAIGDSQLATPPAQPATWTIDELSEANIAQALFSSFSFREKMVNFWQRHFNTSQNTNIGKLQKSPFNLSFAQARDYAAYFEWFMNDVFRVKGMDRFYDLLSASAKGQAMLLYLDSYKNGVNGAINENYARELLELHSLGPFSAYISGPGQTTVVPNYAQTDIVACARILSGWQLADTASSPPAQYNFQFNGANHITLGMGPFDVFPSLLSNPPHPLGRYISPYVGVLTVTEDSTSASEGDALLMHLSNSLVTANFVSRKLYRLLISDVEPPVLDPLILQCINAWGTHPLGGGNLQAVLITLLASNRFQNDAAIRYTLPRSPLESLGQTVAGFQGTAFDPTPGQEAASRARIAGVRHLLEDYVGQFLFRYPAPDGYKVDEVTTMRHMGYDRFRQEMYSLFNLGTYPFVTGSVGFDTLGLFVTWGVSLLNETAIVNFLEATLFAYEETPVDKGYLIDFLSRDSAGNPGAPTLAADFAGNMPEYIRRITQFFAFAASLSLNNLK